MRYAVLGGAQLAVGAAAIFARYALGGAEPLAVAALRLCIAAAVLALIAAFRGRPSGPRATRKQQIVLAAAGVFLGLHFAGWIWSLEYTTVAISTLLVTTTPIFTSLYDAVILKRKPAPMVWPAFAAAALGLVLVVGFQGAAAPHPGHTLLGVALALGGGIAIGAYFLLVREVRGSLGTRSIVSHTYAWAALALVLGALVAHQGPPPLAATQAWLGILAMALVSQLVGHTALNASLRWFTPSGVSMATLLEPVFAAVLALLIFHEGMSLLAIAGGVILLASIGIVLRYESAPQPTPELA